MTDRRRLLTLLHDAAELEHGLTCCYLYAGWSMRRRPGEGLSAGELIHVLDWAEIIMLVARQEMEHVGLVNNIISAVGGAPYLEIPRLPAPAGKFPFPLSLQIFGLETIERFICWESPADAELPFPSPEPAVVAHDGPVRYESIDDLYHQIAETIRAGGDRLFIGPLDAQVGDAELSLAAPRLGAAGGIYDFNFVEVVDEHSALQAVDRIVAEGEGAQHGQDTSHFNRFLRVREQLIELTAANSAFTPTGPIVDDPLLYADGRCGVVITGRPARAVLELFGDCYQLMLLLLNRFFGRLESETDADFAGIIYLAFYPFMTMVIRPLAEIITALPALEGTDGPPFAGPSFEYHDPISMLPHPRAANIVIHDRLVELERRSAAVAGFEGAPERLAYVARSISMVRRKWSADVLGIDARRSPPARRATEEPR